MPLIKNGNVIADEWTVVDPKDAIPEGVPVIVDTARWLEERDVLQRSDRRIGILLKSDELPESLRGDLPRFEVVALEFPHFKDGRPYTSARELRERFGYEGEVRAVGDVGRDQLLFMHRCGFDAFEAPDSVTVRDWQEAISSFSVWYQAGVDARVPVWRSRHQMLAAE